MWAVNLTVGLLIPGRSDPYINAIFGMVVAATFALGRKGTSEQRQGVRRAREKLAELVDPEDPDASEEDAR